MAEIDIGTLLTTFISEDVKLGFVDGADTKFLAMLQEIKPHFEKLETRIDTRLGTKFLFSKNANNFIDAVIAVSRSEIATLTALNVTTNGVLPEKTWKIIGTDVSGSKVGATITAKGVLPILDMEGVGAEGFLFRIRIRITASEVTVS